ncbi:MAG: YlxR family protein [Acidimicrobiales bacterium]
MGCRSTGPVDGLVRVVRMDGGGLAVSRTLPGRGAWLCRDSPGCVEQAVRRHAFSRALRGEVGRAQTDRLVVALGSGAGRPGEDVGPGSGEAVP